MTKATSNRRTIVCAEADMDSVNAQLGLSLDAANWQDGEGRRYAATSFISDQPFDAGVLTNLKVKILNQDTPLEMSSGHVHIINGMDGSLVLEQFGLKGVLPVI